MTDNQNVCDCGRRTEEEVKPKALKPLKPTPKQKKALVEALDLFHLSGWEDAVGPTPASIKHLRMTRLKLLKLLGISEREWRKM